MGHGASTSHKVPEERNATICVPVAELINRVKVYQDSAGEVLIVFDDDAKNVIGNMDGWEMCNYHKKQRLYYETLGPKPIEDVEHSQTRSDSSLQTVEVNPAKTNPTKMKTIQVNKASNNKECTTPPPKTYNDDSSERMKIKVVSEEKKSPTASPNTKYTPIPYSAPSSTLIYNDLTFDARIQSLIGNKKKSSQHSDSSATEEFKSFDGEMFSIHRTKPSVKFPTKCHTCNEVFPDTVQIDIIKEHIEVCAETIEIRKQLEGIDEKLQPSLSELSQSNHLMVREILYNAIAAACTEIDECDSLNNKVQLLARRVINVNHSSTCDGRDVHTLRRDLVNQLNDILSMIDAEYDSGNPDQELLKDLVYFKNLLDDCFNQLKAKIAVLLKYKKTQLKATDFKFIRAIGKGGFGAVYLTQKISNLKLYAIKVMNKASIKKVNFELQILRERKALTKALDYPDYFVRMQGAFQTNEDLFLVMEYVPGGDCMTLLMTLHQFPEHVAQHIVAQVCVAVKHLHLHGVVHRDIKPDNVMITKRGNVKLADFGLIAPYSHQANRMSDSDSNNSRSRQRKSSALSFNDRVLHEDRWLDDDGDLINPDTVSNAYNSSSSLILSKPNYKAEQVGNYHYSSPEMVIRSPYDHTVDWWSVGVMLFHFIAGVTPFDDVTRDKVHENIVLFRVKWDQLPSATSKSCRNFINGIITKTVEERLGYVSSEQVLQHPFFADIDFQRIFHDMGPYYPQVEGKTGKEFHVFAALTESEAYDIPDFTSQTSDEMLNDEFAYYNYFR